MNIDFRNHTFVSEAEITMTVLGEWKQCLVLDSDKQEVQSKLLWIPWNVENLLVVEPLQQFGTVHSVGREQWGWSGMEAVTSSSRIAPAGMLATDTVFRFINVIGFQPLVLIAERRLKRFLWSANSVGTSFSPFLFPCLFFFPANRLASPVPTISRALS